MIRTLIKENVHTQIWYFQAYSFWLYLIIVKTWQLVDTLNVQLGFIHRLTHSNVASEWICITKEAEWIFMYWKEISRFLLKKKKKKKQESLINGSIAVPVSDRHDWRNANIFFSQIHFTAQLAIVESTGYTTHNKSVLPSCHCDSRKGS